MDIKQVRVAHSDYSREQILASIGRVPIIEYIDKDKEVAHWFFWDTEKMEYVDSGWVALIGYIDDAEKAALLARYAQQQAEAAQKAAEIAAERVADLDPSEKFIDEPNELEDYEVESGQFTNAGAGWNTYKFREPFEDIPIVTLQAVNFQGWVEINNVTKEGFQYCLRQINITAGTNGTKGTVTTGKFYTGSGTGTSPSHSEKTLVTAVTPTTPGTVPVITRATTAATIKINYIAIEYGGER